MNGLPHLDAVITLDCPPNTVSGHGPRMSLDGIAPAAWGNTAVQFLEQHIKFHKQRSAVITARPDDGAPEERALLQAISDHYTRTRVNQATIELFAKRWGSHFCRTLRHSPPWATSLYEPFAGMPAFIVSAGPSLDRNGALLQEAQRRGPIICVNTSVSACLYHGVVPDLVLACEAVNLSDHLAPLAGTGTPIVIDATANPANWDVCPDAWAVTSCEPNTIPYVLATGGMPLAYTGSVSCAAVALAIYYGASPIVLLGQDCAYTGGRYYAKGTPYADLTTEIVDDLVIVHGRSKEQEPVSVKWAEGWGSSDAEPVQVPSDHAMAVFSDWFGGAADQHYIVNSTEGGVRIKYTYELPLSTVLDRFPVRTRAPLPRLERADTLATRIELLTAAATVLADPSITLPPSWLPLLNMWTCELGFDHTGTPRERRARRRALMEMGCRAIVEALT